MSNERILLNKKVLTDFGDALRAKDNTSKLLSLEVLKQKILSAIENSRLDTYKISMPDSWADLEPLDYPMIPDHTTYTNVVYARNGEDVYISYGVKSSSEGYPGLWHLSVSTKQLTKLLDTGWKYTSKAYEDSNGVLYMWGHLSSSLNGTDSLIRVKGTSVEQIHETSIGYNCFIEFSQGIVYYGGDELLLLNSNDNTCQVLDTDCDITNFFVASNGAKYARSNKNKYLYVLNGVSFDKISCTDVLGKVIFENSKGEIYFNGARGTIVLQNGVFTKIQSTENLSYFYETVNGYIYAYSSGWTNNFLYFIDDNNKLHKIYSKSGEYNYQFIEDDKDGKGIVYLQLSDSTFLELYGTTANEKNYSALFKTENNDLFATLPTGEFYCINGGAETLLYNVDNFAIKTIFVTSKGLTYVVGSVIGSSENLFYVTPTTAEIIGGEQTTYDAFIETSKGTVYVCGSPRTSSADYTIFAIKETKVIKVTTSKEKAFNMLFESKTGRVIACHNSIDSAIISLPIEVDYTVEEISGNLLTIKGYWNCLCDLSESSFVLCDTDMPSTHSRCMYWNNGAFYELILSTPSIKPALTTSEIETLLQEEY